MMVNVSFKSDDKSVAIHVSVDERVEGEYVDTDEFLRDVFAGFEDTFGKSWDHGVELGTSSDTPEIVFSMPGTFGDLVGVIGLHGSYDSVFRGFIEEAVEKAHAEAIERRREVIRAGERPKLARMMAEVAIETLVEAVDFDEVFGRVGVSHIIPEDGTPLTREVSAGVLAEFMANPVGFLIGQLRAPMPESAATPAALSTAKMPVPMAPHKLVPVDIDVPSLDEAEPEPNGPTDPTGGEGDDVPLDEVWPKQAEAEAKPAPSPETEPDAPEVDEAELREFHAGRAGNAGEWIALVAARGTVTLTEAAEALGTTTKALGGITGGVTRASRSSGVYVPIDTIESDGERAWTWTGPDMDLGWTEPKPIDEAEDPEVGTAPPTVPDAPSVDEAEPEPNGPTDPTGGDDRQIDITDFIEPGATANDPEFPIGDGVDEDPFAIDEDDAAAVGEHIAEVVEAEIVSDNTDESEPEPNGPTDPSGDAEAILSHEKIVALDLDSDEKKVLRFIVSAGPVTQEQIEASIGGAWRDIAKGVYKKWVKTHGHAMGLIITFEPDNLTYTVNTDALG